MRRTSIAMNIWLIKLILKDMFATEF